LSLVAREESKLQSSRSVNSQIGHVIGASGLDDSAKASETESATRDTGTPAAADTADGRKLKASRNSSR
jgi:hypothetical protein